MMATTTAPMMMGGQRDQPPKAKVNKRTRLQMLLNVCLDENLMKDERSHHAQSDAEHPAWKERTQNVNRRRSPAAGETNQADAHK